MIDIDEYARRAVASPIAQPPEMATVTSLAKRRRRRRMAFRATVLAFVAVIGIAALAVVSAPDRGSRVEVVGPRRGGTHPSAEFTAADLEHELTRAGARVSSDGTAPADPLAPTAQLLCVNGTQVRVHEYADRASRGAVSDTISPYGSPVVETYVSWIGTPHFFARGRIIVLVLQDDTAILQDLTAIMGPTISPQAKPMFRGIVPPCNGSTDAATPGRAR